MSDVQNITQVKTPVIIQEINKNYKLKNNE